MISGFQLPYKSEKQLKADRVLSVQVRVGGVDDDVQSDRTRIVKNNGTWHPVNCNIGRACSKEFFGVHNLKVHV